MRRGCAIPARRLSLLASLCFCGAVSPLAMVSCRTSDAATQGNAAAAVHPARTIRVLLVRDTDRVVVSTSGRLRVRDRNGRDLSDPLPPLKRAPILFGHHSPTAMVVGPHRITAEVIDLVPEAGQRIELLMPAGGNKEVMRRYPGFLRCLLKNDGTADIINVVDVEAYLRGVLRGEVPPNWHRETYKAQAIAARTYVLYEKGTVGRNRHWDVTSTARSQMYVGIDRNTEKTKAARAVDATRGIVLTWPYPEGDRIFCAYYSAVCGGTTQDASLVGDTEHIPPLAGGVECEYCWRAPKGTYRWKPVTFTKEAIGRALARRYDAFAKLGPVAGVEVTERTADHRARTIRVTDREGKSADLPAEAFRLTIDPTGWIVKSTHFRIRDDGSAVTFTHGRGWGHGAGLCQWGAEGMARDGATAEEILAHYYPGSKLVKVYD
jgi:stage II sporulation protein D